MLYDTHMDTHMDTHTRVLIVGGGLAGLTLALILGKNQVPTVVLDATPAPTDTDCGDTRTTAFMPASVQYLKTLGVWDVVQPHTAPLNTLRILPIMPRNIMGQAVDFNASDVGLPALAYNLDNHKLRTVLCKHIADCDSVNHLYNTPAMDMIQVDKTWYIRTNTGNFSADILVGADGRKSLVREKSGIPCTTHDYNQTAMVFNVQHTISHNNISTEMMYTEGAFTLVPLPDIYQSAVVWVEKSDTAHTLIQNKDMLHKAFIKKTQGLWGDCNILSSVQSFPLHTHMAQTNIQDNIALMGESHHGLTPVAAQGLNLSLRDSAVLGEWIIHAHTHTWNTDIILHQYHKNRLTDVKTRSMATNIFHKFARTSDPLSLAVKSFGIGVLNRIPSLKTTAIKAGLSLPSGTPKFMK